MSQTQETIEDHLMRAVAEGDDRAMERLYSRCAPGLYNYLRKLGCSRTDADDVLQAAFLKAPNSGSSDRFGISLRLTGDLLAVGATGEASDADGVDGDAADNSANFAGAAYVFAHASGSWNPMAYVKASNSDEGDEFETVALSGASLLVIARGEESVV